MLYTKKEYQERKNKAVPDVKKLEDIVKESSVEQKARNIYYLFHPEINNDLNCEIEVNNEVVSIVRGRVNTKSETTKNKLVEMGYVFMYEKEM